jgi:hypothetical protein
MNRSKPLILLFILIFLLLSLPVYSGATSQTITARLPLPHVSPKMEKPPFWINKIKIPGHLLLRPEEIQRMNENNLKRKDLYLFSLNDLQEDLSKEEILAFLKEDWDAFVNPREARYGRDGYPLGKSFWVELKNNLNQESLKERNRVLFGLVVKRSDIRVFPTEEQSRAKPGEDAFDRFQHSSISPGSLMGIYHVSKDNRWAYVQSQFTRGWVQTNAFAIAKERKEALEYQEEKTRLVITGSFVKVFGDPSLRQVVFLAQMGNTFPLISRPAQPQTTESGYIISIPVREDNGQLTFGKGYLPGDGDVREGFLPYTQENVARQAFKMLNEPYGWGDMFEGRDCSRFIMDLFASFGIVMPRNSKFQASVGKNLGEMDRKRIKEKKNVLDRAIPLATVLRLPGHIMLYLGKDHGMYYAIHNIWGIEKGRSSNRVLEKIGKVVVSDLSLGESGPHGSLLQRITDVRFIGANGNSPLQFHENR